MSASSWLQLGVLVAILLVTTRVLGAYIAGVFGGGRALRRPGLPPRRAGDLPRLRRRSDPRADLARVRVRADRVQPRLCPRPVRPAAHPGSPAARTRPTRRQCRPPSPSTPPSRFVTNTNWQNYGGELTMSHLTQMAGLTVQNFLSAAVGLAVAVALIRGLRPPPLRDDRQLLGRSHARHDPGAAAARGRASRSCSSSQGVVQNLHGFTHATTVQGVAQSIPGGPIASQEAIKELGDERRRPVQRQLCAPVREPERLHQPVRDPRSS